MPRRGIMILYDNSRIVDVPIYCQKVIIIIDAYNYKKSTTKRNEKRYEGGGLHSRLF